MIPNQMAYERGHARVEVGHDAREAVEAHLEADQGQRAEAFAEALHSIGASVVSQAPGDDQAIRVGGVDQAIEDVALSFEADRRRERTADNYP